MTYAICKPCIMVYALRLKGKKLKDQKCNQCGGALCLALKEPLSSVNKYRSGWFCVAANRGYRVQVACLQTLNNYV